MKFIDSEGLRTLWGIIKKKFLPLSGGEMEHSASIQIAQDDGDLEGDKYGVKIDNTGFFVGNLGDSMTQHVYVTASGIQTESKEPNQVFTTDGKTVYLKTINGQEIYSNSAGDTNIQITASGDYLPTSGGTLTGKLEITGQGSGSTHDNPDLYVSDSASNGTRLYKDHLYVGDDENNFMVDVMAKDTGAVIDMRCESIEEKDFIHVNLKPYAEPITEEEITALLK